MVAKNSENVVNLLKMIIDRNGPHFLTDEPYLVYCELTDSGLVDIKTASAVLYILTAGIPESIDFSYDAEQISEIIRRECCLNKKMSDGLALILTSLYSGKNKKEWKGKNKAGLRLFLKEEFVCTWHGFAVWDAGNGTVDCNYEAEIILMPTDKISKDKELAEQIKKNPFITKEVIHDLFAKRLQKYLDYEFEEYCTCDDYYAPSVEDFGSNMLYDLPIWCDKNGFTYVSFDGDGDAGDYEPKYRRGWY